MTKAKTETAPEVDLNGEGMTDYGSNTPFLPFGESKVTAQLTHLAYHKGFKGRAYRAKIKILTSDRKDISVGYPYMIQFKLSDDELKKEIAMKGLRSVCAAVYDADPADKEFNGNAALATLTELSTNDMLEDENMVFEIVSREKQATDKKTKEPVTNKDGTPKMFTNQFYNKVVKAEAA